VNEGVRSSPRAEYKRSYAAKSGQDSNTANGKRQVDDGSSELVHVHMALHRHKHLGRLGWLVNRPQAPLSDPAPTARTSIRRYVRAARYFGSGIATPVTPVRHLWTATGRRRFGMHHVEASSRPRAAVAEHTTRLQTLDWGPRLVSFHGRDVGPT
jgi:hypothetical protein